MGSPGDGALRVARTVAVTAVVVGLAVAAHVAGGGRPPRALGLVGLALATAYVCAWLARRRLSLPVLAGVLAAGQWALHHTFDVLEASCATTIVPAAHAGHTVAAGSCEPVAAAAGSGLAAGQHLAAPSWAMLLAHVAATLVSALVLASGERALWALCGLLATLVPALPRAAAPVAVPARRAPDVPAAPRPRRAVLLRTSPRRGPPAASPRPWASLAA
jgi:hypothetical protein